MTSLEGTGDPSLAFRPGAHACKQHDTKKYKKNIAEQNFCMKCHFVLPIKVKQ